ncbi:MAG: sensor histidine kinase [Xenococcaceae cyanobacterium]
MNRLVSDLLILAKAEQPDFIRPQLIEVEALTQELYEKSKVLSKGNLQLEALGRGQLYIDRQRLTQAIMNLVDNAVRYTTSEANIFFGSACNDSDTRFWVKDTGMGIAVYDRQRIFNRFARASNSRRRSDGYGLGLSITKAIVTACGGSIELESDLGKGSTFTLIFPVDSVKGTQKSQD